MLNNTMANIKKKILERGLSATDIEKLSGLKESSVRNILSGRSKNPRANTVVAIANAVGCTVNELICGEEQAYKNSEKMVDDTPWNLHLFVDSVRVVNDSLEKRSITPSFNTVLFVIKEVYSYSTKSNVDEADYTFAAWLVDNINKNHSNQ
jgi:transcriptional regulator with XRE-family HTH domain